MFGRIGRFTYRRRWPIVWAWLVVLIVSLAMASQVGKVLGPGEFVLKNSDSGQARTVLNNVFRQDGQKVLLVVIRNEHSTVQDIAFRRTVHRLAGKLQADRDLKIRYLDDPTASGNAQLIGKDGHAVAIMASSALSEQQIEGKIDALRTQMKTAGYSTYITGTPATNHDFAVQQLKDLQKGDSITIPIMLFILLVVFGSLVSAGLPLALALVSIMMSLALVYAFGHVLSASVYVENVVMFLGLGISIDYSLFIVYRFREELRLAGNDVEPAVVRTMQTTGRAVFFSAITVAIGLSSLMLTGLPFMISMGLGGILTPLCAIVVAMTLLPALLGILGHRVNRFRVIPSRFLQGGSGKGWQRLAAAIMKRPVISGGVVLAVMLALVFPMTQMTQAYGGLKNAPKSESVQGFLYMRAHFPLTPDPMQVVIEHTGPGTVLSTHEMAGIRALEGAIRQIPEASKVIGPADVIAPGRSASSASLHAITGRYVSANGRYAIISAVPKHDTGSKAADDMVGSLRDTVARYQAGTLKDDRIHVGGAAADYLDFDNALSSKFPYVVGAVLILTYAFLFFAFRSVFLPLKAVLLNLLSVGASYGMLQLVFQRGIGSSILGFSPEDGIAPWVPIFLFAFLFGLSMDYEVFLLSRMREHWLLTGNNRESVQLGLARTGRLITSAALIMVIAFSGILFGRIVDLKEFGFGLVASVALDATLIRVVLVPSIMEIMGDWNWWTPSFLSRFAGGSSFAEDAPVPAEEAVAA